MLTHLAISFTPNYFIPTAVMLRSVLNSSQEGRFKVYCLVCEDIPERQQNMLREMCGGRMEFEYINLSGRLEGCYVDPRYSEAASYRLMLPELLPDLNKIIYLDCDIIVRQDLAALDSLVDISGNYLAAVFEAPIENQSQRWEALGCDPGKYFNSGFLVMNLARMRKEKVSEKLLAVLHRDYLEFPDQDALNIVCKGRVEALTPVYNSIRTFFLPQYRTEFEKQYGPLQRLAVETFGNIHYTGGKPWNLFTVRFGDWWETYDSLPDDIKSEWVPNKKVLRLWKIYRTGFGRWTLDTMQAIYRKIKH